MILGHNSLEFGDDKHDGHTNEHPHVLPEEEDTWHVAASVAAQAIRCQFWHLKINLQNTC